MHERRFSGDIARLRSPDRVAKLQVEVVVELCLDGEHFDQLIDVGTGSGLFAELFMKHNLAVTGVDANPGMLTAAKSYVPNGIFLQATAEDLPFAKGSFDLAFYGLVLHEADDPLWVLQCAHRVSRKRVCVLEWPYREGQMGPPLADRISPTRMKQLIYLAGFSNWQCTNLLNTDLYRLDI